MDTPSSLSWWALAKPAKKYEGSAQRISTSIGALAPACDFPMAAFFGVYSERLECPMHGTREREIECVRSLPPRSRGE